MAETLLSIPDVMQRLRCGKSTAYLMLSGQHPVLPSVRIGRALKVREVVLDRFIREGGVAKLPKYAGVGSAENGGARPKAGKRASGKRDR
jgi:hypothetical protein